MNQEDFEREISRRDALIAELSGQIVQMNRALSDLLRGFKETSSLVEETPPASTEGAPTPATPVARAGMSRGAKAILRAASPRL